MADKRWNPLSLTPLLRLRWRKSAVLACLPPFRCAGASAVLARNCTRTSTLDRSDVLFFQIIFSKIDYYFHILVLNCNHFNNSTFHFPNFNKSRHLFILTEKQSRTKLTQPLSAWRGGGGGYKSVELWVPSGARRKFFHRIR